jgi:hypothetical protein
LGKMDGNHSPVLSEFEGGTFLFEDLIRAMI